MSDVLRTCRRTWRRLGVKREAAAEMAAELEADLAAAAEEQVSPAEYVGRDARVLAAQWASARGLVRPRLRVASAAVAAVVGAIPGASLGLFAAYGLSSQAIADMIGSPVQVGERSYVNSYTPPDWLLLSLYALALVFAYAGAVAAVAGFLRWRLDTLAQPTARLLAAALPLGAAAALGASVLFAWSREFSTTPRVVIGDAVVAVLVFAASVAAVRVIVLLRQTPRARRTWRGPAPPSYHSPENGP